MTTPAVPSAVHRALAGDEDVVAVLHAGRVGAHALPPVRRRASALGLWVSAMSLGASVKKHEGLVVPARCWLVLTDRCLVAVSTDTRERQLDRRVSLRRVTHVDTTRRDGRPVLRVGLLGGEKLVVEIQPASEAELAEFVAKLRRAADERAVAGA